MTFPVVQATNTSTQVASTNHTIAMPAGIAVGDLLLIFTATSAGFTNTVGFTELATMNNGVVGRCHYKIADGSEGASVIFTTGASVASAHVAMRISGYSGLPEASAAATGASAAPDPSSLTPTWGSGDTLWAAAVAARGGGNPTITAYPASYSGGITAAIESGVNDICVAAASRQLAAASDDPGAFTASASVSWAALTVGIRALSAGRSFGIVIP